MSAQGLYNPDSFVPSNPATFPTVTVPGVPPTDGAGVTLYQPGMYWECDRDGSFAGFPVVLGDWIYVQGRSTTIGELPMGRGWIGNPPGFNWAPETASFVVVPQGVPWRRTPDPFAGCPIRDGWRLVVEVLERDEVNDSLSIWHDVTADVVAVQVTRGPQYGATPFVPVDQITIDTAAPYRAGDVDQVPQVGRFCRVGLFDPATNYWPGATGRIEQIQRPNDATRTPATWNAYGTLMDTVVALPQWTRPSEPAATRIESLFASSGWSWAPAEYAATPGWSLLAEPAADTQARAEIERAALSGGWFVTTKRDGTPVLADYPPEPVTDPDAGWLSNRFALLENNGAQLVNGPHPSTGIVRVVDCDMLDRCTDYQGTYWDRYPLWPDGTAPGQYWALNAPWVNPDGWEMDPGDLVVYWAGQYWPVLRRSVVAARTVELADMAELLNTANVANTNSPPDVVTATDPASVTKYGVRSVGYGMPATNLSTLSTLDMGTLANRVVAAGANLVDRPFAVTGETLTDPDWWRVAARIEVGTPVLVVILKPSAGERSHASGIAVGAAVTIGPNSLRINLALTGD